MIIDIMNVCFLFIELIEYLVEVKWWLLFVRQYLLFSGYFLFGCSPLGARVLHQEREIPRYKQGPATVWLRNLRGGSPNCREAGIAPRPRALSKHNWKVSTAFFSAVSKNYCAQTRQFSGQKSRPVMNAPLRARVRSPESSLEAFAKVQSGSNATTKVAQLRRTLTASRKLSSWRHPV